LSLSDRLPVSASYASTASCPRCPETDGNGPTGRTSRRESDLEQRILSHGAPPRHRHDAGCGVRAPGGALARDCLPGIERSAGYDHTRARSTRSTPSAASLKGRSRNRAYTFSSWRDYWRPTASWRPGSRARGRTASPRSRRFSSGSKAVPRQTSWRSPTIVKSWSIGPMTRRAGAIAPPLPGQALPE